MAGGHDPWANPWTKEQLARLAQHVDAAAKGKRRANWKAIALELGHSATSCHVKMSTIRVRRRNERIRERTAEEEANAKAREKARREAGKAQVLKAPRVPDPPYNRSTSTARLQWDAELRARIEVLGITGGMLGDPAPGRSALEQKRAGIASPKYFDHKTPHERAKPSLPTAPLR